MRTGAGVEPFCWRKRRGRAGRIAKIGGKSGRWRWRPRGSRLLKICWSGIGDQTICTPMPASNSAGGVQWLAPSLVENLKGNAVMVADEEPMLTPASEPGPAAGRGRPSARSTPPRTPCTATAAGRGRTSRTLRTPCTSTAAGRARRRTRRRSPGTAIGAGRARRWIRPRTPCNGTSAGRGRRTRSPRTPYTPIAAGRGCTGRSHRNPCTGS